MTATTPPDRLSADPSSKFCDAAKLERGIHVFLDGKEYLDIEEYCTTEDWMRLPAGRQELALVGRSQLPSVGK